MASDSCASPSISPNHVSTLVSIKLTESNYLLWESQIKPFLIGHNYWRFIDGTHSPPSPTLPSPVNDESSPQSDSSSSAITASSVPLPNPAYHQWYQIDQTLISMLRATLTESVLSQVVGLNTSREIWECLRQNFSQQSLANATNLRFQLMSLTKGSQSVSDYLNHAKTLADSLAAINEPFSSRDFVTAVLRGFGSEYSMLVTAMLNFPPLPPFTDLRARLFSFEAQQASTLQPAAVNPPIALYTAHPGPAIPVDVLVFSEALDQVVEPASPTATVLHAPTPQIPPLGYSDLLHIPQIAPLVLNAGPAIAMATLLLTALICPSLQITTCLKPSLVSTSPTFQTRIGTQTQVPLTMSPWILSPLHNIQLPPLNKS